MGEALILIEDATSMVGVTPKCDRIQLELGIAEILVTLSSCTLRGSHTSGHNAGPLHTQQLLLGLCVLLIHCQLMDMRGNDLVQRRIQSAAMLQHVIQADARDRISGDFSWWLPRLALGSPQLRRAQVVLRLTRHVVAM